MGEDQREWDIRELGKPRPSVSDKSILNRGNRESTLILKRNLRNGIEYLPKQDDSEVSLVLGH